MVKPCIELRARMTKFIQVLVPSTGTTCHILQMDRDPLASRRSTRLVRLACHKYMVIIRGSNAIRTRIKYMIRSI